MADPNFIEYEFWLTFSHAKSKQGPAPRTTKNEPPTHRMERAVKCKARLPRSLFMTPSVSMVMDVPYIEAPDVLANVDAAADAFRQTLGLDVHMQIVPAEADAIDHD